MAKTRILIVDDERIARSTIRDFLEERGDAFVIEEAANGVQALEMIPRFKPDLMFLDVEMPELSAFDVLSHLEDRTIKIVFVTAYEEFALRAFEENACDYLLKPFSRERFAQALNRALQAARTESALKGLEHAVLPQMNYLQKIVVKQGSRSIILREEDIVCFVSREHYTHVNTRSGEYLSELSLNHFEQRLNPNHFIRLHRNNIVKIDEVASVSSKEQMTVTLRNGLTLPVSKQGRKLVKDFLEGLA